MNPRKASPRVHHVLIFRYAMSLLLEKEALAFKAVGPSIVTELGLETFAWLYLRVF